jgi:hypothetical protein
MDNEVFSDESSIALEKTISEVPVAREGKVTELHLLGFAKTILLFVFIAFVASAISELLFNGNAVYESCKITLPPIATLVIGYYFGSAK